MRLGWIHCADSGFRDIRVCVLLPEGFFVMRKMLMLVLTVALGLASVNSASAGFIAGTNTKVGLLKNNYTNPAGLVNKFAPVTPGVTKMVTSTGGDPTFLPPVYSASLPAAPVGGYSIYLVAVTGPAGPVNFSANTTNGEYIVGVAASNNRTDLLNIVGTYSGLQADVKSVLEGFYGGPSANIDAAVVGFFGKGPNALEINSPFRDSLTMTNQSLLNGSVDDVGIGADSGLKELFLVITVPEPSTLGLFGIGTLVFGLARSRRKKS